MDEGDRGRPRDTGPYSGGPYSGGPYTGGYGDPLTSGPQEPYRPAGYRTGEYRSSDDRVSGGYRAGRDPGAAAGAGRSDAYRASPYGAGYDSGEHASGGYRTGERRAGGPPRSGGRRSASGSHRVRERRRGGGLFVLLGGLVAAVGVCVLAAFAILRGVGGTGGHDAGQVVGTGAAESSPSAKGERSLMPDACATLPAAIAGRLAPGADRTQADNYQSNDRQNQCVWGAYTGDHKRQLTVELRSVAGTSADTPTEAARKAFTGERTADESGKALLAGQEIAEKKPLDGLGDEGYVVYSVDRGEESGEAVANVRLANVLITVHYSGGDGGEDGTPLSAGKAIGGATEAARGMVDALNRS
ncbi:hypothetical protein [Actinomadura parmotrematis]|uniref:DUF3558 domain-containing protein n=1 Tax=Actinomadura parmotrematis TaxID=2864039 RepID=A0ABS7G3X8_9ACTN|nr:hypothetical protein [Actinomadura parmotrematis]MBW8487428.1 hypothetical protein [Actinomadura parmotrematis]